MNSLTLRKYCSRASSVFSLAPLSPKPSLDSNTLERDSKDSFCNLSNFSSIFPLVCFLISNIFFKSKYCSILPKITDFIGRSLKESFNNSIPSGPPSRKSTKNIVPFIIIEMAEVRIKYFRCSLVLLFKIFFLIP